MLEKKIEQKRQQMITCAKRYGLGAKATLQCSQELDELLNRFQRFGK